MIYYNTEIPLHSHMPMLITIFVALRCVAVSVACVAVRGGALRCGALRACVACVA